MNYISFMCGIFGSFGIIDKQLLIKSVKEMTHRGPDSKGYYVDDKVMLGVRRLAIVDKNNGTQPVFNEDFGALMFTFVQIRPRRHNRTGTPPHDGPHHRRLRYDHGGVRSG